MSLDTLFVVRKCFAATLRTIKVEVMDEKTFPQRKLSWIQSCSKSCWFWWSHYQKQPKKELTVQIFVSWSQHSHFVFKQHEPSQSLIQMLTRVWEALQRWFYYRRDAENPPKKCWFCEVSNFFEFFHTFFAFSCHISPDTCSNVMILYPNHNSMFLNTFLTLFWC